MKRGFIDLFVGCGSAEFSSGATLERLATADFIGKIHVAGVVEENCFRGEKISCLSVSSLYSTAAIKEMVAVATAEFVMICFKGVPIIEVADMEKFCSAVPMDAAMAYADYYKISGGEKQPAPTIDYSDGSLRDDFDFGPVLLVRTVALKEFVSWESGDYRYAGLYSMRLALSRVGRIFHYNEFLCSEPERDNRNSGEKQFDYVNPAQREVQVEMEAACTAHLKEIGAYLPACLYEPIDLSAGDFPVEASVIIPVLNRVSTIADAINSVLAQKTGFPFNIIVADNHSTDGTGDIIDGFDDPRVVHIIPERNDLGIGGCWNEAVNSPACGRFAVQLDSDDLYSSPATLQRIVDEFRKQNCAMLIGSYRICDFNLNTLPPGVIDHREWSEENGRNNALRINGLGAPRAFYTPAIRSIGFPNVSYGEDYAVGLQMSRRYRIGRIYDVLYLCRRWGGNSDAALSHEKVNANNRYKDSLRTAELQVRRALVDNLKIPSLPALEAFFNEQLREWHQAADAYEALEWVKTRRLDNGITLQYNPARIVSTAARVAEGDVAARPCFLCEENRPAGQIALAAAGNLTVLVNPYPVLPFHFTIPTNGHTPQMFCGLLARMLHLSREWQGMALFYNGSKCGASAPDHAHLQAVRVCDVPLFGKRWSAVIDDTSEPLSLLSGSVIYRVTGYMMPLFKISALSVSDAVELFGRLFVALPRVDGECEPRLNAIARYDAVEGYELYVVPRGKHRPACYGSGEGERLVSPGALDVAGLVVTPRESDFNEITADEAVALLREVAIDDATANEVCENLRQS